MSLVSRNQECNYAYVSHKNLVRRGYYLQPSNGLPYRILLRSKFSPHTFN